MPLADLSLMTLRRRAPPPTLTAFGSPLEHLRLLCGSYFWPRMLHTGLRVLPENSSVKVGVSHCAVSAEVLETFLRPLNFCAVTR